MKKYLKISAVILFIGLVAVISGCSMFTGLGKVVTNFRTTGTIANPSEDSFTLNVYLYKVADNASNAPITSKPTTLIEEHKIQNVAFNQNYSITFDNEVQVGTKVRIFIGLKTKTSGKYYRLQSNTFVIEEGINRPTLGSFEEVSSDSEEIFWSF